MRIQALVLKKSFGFRRTLITEITFPGMRWARRCGWLPEVLALVLKKSFVLGKQTAREFWRNQRVWSLRNRDTIKVMPDRTRRADRAFAECGTVRARRCVNGCVHGRRSYNRARVCSTKMNETERSSQEFDTSPLGARERDPESRTCKLRITRRDGISARSEDEVKGLEPAAAR